MIPQSLQERVDQYQDIYHQLKKDLKWKVSDKRMLMMIASMYVTNQKPFEKDRFLRVSDFIKKEVGLFSTLKSSYRFTIAALLDVRFEDPEEKFATLMEYYRSLVDEKFNRTIFTYISAYVLLANQQEDIDETIKKSMEMYKGMSENHPFLTSSSDYPLAVLLASGDGPIKETLDCMERFYTKLDEKSFRKGNELQFLSHFLTFKQDEDESGIVERCDEIFETCKRLGKKPKAQHYPSIGILSLIDQGNQEVERVLDVHEQLNNEKEFKWHKDANFTMAVNLTMSNHFDAANLMNTGIYASLETIIQAQQVAMVAGVAGAAAASGGDGGG